MRVEEGVTVRVSCVTQPIIPSVKFVEINADNRAIIITGRMGRAGGSSEEVNMRRRGKRKERCNNKIIYFIITANKDEAKVGFPAPPRASA